MKSGGGTGDSAASFATMRRLASPSLQQERKP